MSHEIRTPLNAILGMTDARAADHGSRPSSSDYLTTVKSSADALLAVVNDILDFSKIEARRLDLDHAEFDLRETVGDAAKALALRAAEKGPRAGLRHPSRRARVASSATPAASARCC